MANPDVALAAFAQGYNCSQSVLVAAGTDLGLDRECCLRISAGFGGGIARRAETCGAVTGALMALGLRYGQMTVDDPAKKAEMYAICQQFVQQFVAQFGALNCRDLLGCDMSTPEGMEEAKARNTHATLCNKFVAGAIEILNAMY